MVAKRTEWEQRQNYLRGKTRSDAEEKELKMIAEQKPVLTMMITKKRKQERFEEMNKDIQEAEQLRDEGIDLIEQGVSKIKKQKLAKIRNDVQAGIKPLESPWKVLGNPLECPWKPLGMSLETPWKVLGKSLECPWKVLGKSLETPWNVLGKSLESPWKPLGKSLESPWKVLGKSLESPWKVLGKSLESPWKPLGKSRTHLNPEGIGRGRQGR